MAVCAFALRNARVHPLSLKPYPHNAIDGHGLRMRGFGSSRPTRKDTNSKAQDPVSPETERLRGSARDKLLDREFFLSVLNSSITKREARSYLSRFKPPIPGPSEAFTRPQSKSAKGNIPTTSENGGRHILPSDVYSAPVSVEQTPVFAQQTSTGQKPVAEETIEQLHVALVKIRVPQLLDDNTMEGIGSTLSQLRRLGLVSTVVLDCEQEGGPGSNDERSLAVAQADRLVRAIESTKASRAVRLDSILDLSTDKFRIESTVSVLGKVRVGYRQILVSTLKRGIIPILPSIAYSSDGCRASVVAAEDVALALTREFAGIPTKPFTDEDPLLVAEKITHLQKQFSLDRLIILDPVGGIPAADRQNSAHVFINMEQEYDDIYKELYDDGLPSPSPSGSMSDGTLGLSKVAAEEREKREVHIKNLRLLKDALALLPPTTSALLTTPEEVALSSRRTAGPSEASRVGTRRHRNPLIHNLLTDKPVISSSLPMARLRSPSIKRKSDSSPVVLDKPAPTTFVKRGMPLTMLPDPRLEVWKPLLPGEPVLTLNDPRIDLPRLVHLIEDSFNRRLDIEHYLERINDRIAGVIIAGEYEGGALLTWELPPGVPADGSAASRARMVPYLDKFAVLKRSQGAGGVADVVFNAMVRSCFPAGVCWRSRRDNPVNKWYFERARGTWQIPGSNWTMFWTTPRLVDDERRFADYERVCRSVMPSWADQKPPE